MVLGATETRKMAQRIKDSWRARLRQNPRLNEIRGNTQAYLDFQAAMRVCRGARIQAPAFEILLTAAGYLADYLLDSGDLHPNGHLTHRKNHIRNLRRGQATKLVPSPLA